VDRGGFLGGVPIELGGKATRHVRGRANRPSDCRREPDLRRHTVLAGTVGKWPGTDRRRRWLRLVDGPGSSRQGGGLGLRRLRSV
jgi:hypothetical protein